MTALLDLPAPMDNLSSLRHFYNETAIYVRTLDSLGQSECTYGSLLVPVILKKLPGEIKQNMTREFGSSNWTLGCIRKFLLKELDIMEAGVNPSESSYQSTAAFVTNDKRFRDHPDQPKYYKVCAFCKSSHFSSECQRVTDYTERIEIVKRDKLCFNCLGKHRVADCKSKSTCKNCSRRHHTSICKTKHEGEDKSETDRVKEKNTAIMHSSNMQPTGPVLLKTAIADVQSKSTTCEANILFDEGAQRSFISSDIAKKLDLEICGRETHYLSGFGDKNRQVRHLETAKLKLKTDNEDIEIKVLVVPEIAVPLKTYQNSANKLPYLRGLKLAHPFDKYDTFQISVLIGADYYWHIVQDKVVRGNGPTAVKSKLGYLLSGPLSVTNDNTRHTAMMNVLTSHTCENIDIERFWKVESMGLEEEGNDVNGNYEEYMTNYQKTSISYNPEENKYYAKLPWKDSHKALPPNEYIARRRTKYVIDRLQKEPQLLKKYGEIIAEQERHGFIEKVTDVDSEQKKIHYIPHHYVKKDSTTTPIRIVYDCSCKSSKESTSLNECLESIPPVLNDISSILVRFRAHQYAVTTDIEKAFLNVGLSEEDRDVTRFFWLSDPDDPSSDLQVYRFKSVLFGATCSPFILNAVIQKHLSTNQCAFSELISKDLYVDNIISSFQDRTTLNDYYRVCHNIFKDAGFNVRSWASNDESLQETAKSENVAEDKKTTKVLGMMWNTNNDTISFAKRNINTISTDQMTKRELLKQASSIYDPLGLMSPLTVKSKILMQSLWKQKLEWDEPLPENVVSEWNKIKSDIDDAIEMELPRCYFSDIQEDLPTLHIFTDSSMKAYGACAYLVSKEESTLVMAKNRVAPIKTLTIPKLELMGAYVGAKLADHIRKNIQCKKVIFWSDSQVVLSWISSSKQQNTFVSNRTKKIKELSGDNEWRYCPTDSNPADLLSRGITLKRFREDKLWLQGPSWLTTGQYPELFKPFPSEKENEKTNDTSKTLRRHNNKIQSSHHNHSENNNECLPTTQLSVIDEHSHIGISNVVKVGNFSSYNKLLSVIAYVMRFINRCRGSQKEKGHITVTEKNDALRLLIKDVQHTSFPDIYKMESLNTNSNLVKQLDLYLDENNIVRCGGRISNACLHEDRRFPILLPTHHDLTDIIITSAHRTQLHCGTESLVTYLRQKFWIPKMRQRVKFVVHKCVSCRKVTGKPYGIPDPPPLPKDRVQEGPPFSVTGVDFTGAMYTKNKDGSYSKAYICLFTCAKTRAIHLEIVNDMTLDSFMLAFRRFISRKSTPIVMMSDNALTYTAAANILKNPSVLAQHGITWKFIPQHAPWYGGWWERLIGLTKTCIKRVLGKSLVSIETLQTLITEVECIINDRPLTYVSSDHLDESPLTPSHLLYGRRISTPVLPQDSYDEGLSLTRSAAKKTANYTYRTIQHFWNRWKNEYLTSLRDFHKVKHKVQKPPKIGDVVLVHDEYINRTKWPIAVVDELITGKDGLTRAARVRTNRGVTIRPIKKLYPLEVSD